MSDIQLPPEVEQFIEETARGDRSTALALHALVCAARDSGDVIFNDVAILYRENHLRMLRETGGDADKEAGRLSLDEVRTHLSKTVLPRLVQEGLIILPPGRALLARARPVPCGHQALQYQQRPASHG